MPPVAAADEQVLHTRRMAIAGGPLKPVDAQIQNPPLLPELLGDHVGIFLRRLTLRLRRSLDVDAVLVRAGFQDHVETLHLLQPFDRVRGNGRIRVPDVGRGVGVVDRRGQIIFHFRFFKYASLAAAITCGSGVPVRAAIARQSSYSGAKAPCPETFMRTFPNAVSTSTIRRSSTRRSAA